LSRRLFASGFGHILPFPGAQHSAGGHLQAEVTLLLQPSFHCPLPYLALAHLFVKVPRPGDSEVTFSVMESSCHFLLPD